MGNGVGWGVGCGVWGVGCGLDVRQAVEEGQLAMAAVRQEMASNFEALQRAHSEELARASTRQRDLQRRHDSLVATVADRDDVIAGLRDQLRLRDAALVAAGECVLMARQDATAFVLRDVDKLKAEHVRFHSHIYCHSLSHRAHVCTRHGLASSGVAGRVCGGGCLHRPQQPTSVWGPVPPYA
jgi:hypothetical protein